MNGAELKQLREAKGVSQQVVADSTGVPKGTIGRIEASGEEIKKASVLQALSKYFNFESTTTEPKPNTDMQSHELTAAYKEMNAMLKRENERLREENERLKGNTDVKVNSGAS